ncbi:MAG: hypothetical protein MMC33_009986 [Icmadophila ericetorum]|nr:hypothetical protein [Icmadophila ericetorum]
MEFAERNGRELNPSALGVPRSDSSLPTARLLVFDKVLTTLTPLNQFMISLQKHSKAVDTARIKDLSVAQKKRLNDAKDKLPLVAGNCLNLRCK